MWPDLSHLSRVSDYADFFEVSLRGYRAYFLGHTENPYAGVPEDHELDREKTWAEAYKQAETDHLAIL